MKRSDLFNVSIAVAVVLLCSLFALFILRARGSFEKPPIIEVFPENCYEETIDVVYDIDYQPYCGLTQDGRMSGHDIELINIIANKLKVNVNLRALPWGEVLSEAEAGNTDFILACELTNTNSREGQFRATTPTAFDYFVAFGKKPALTIPALFGKRLGILIDANAQTEVDELKIPGDWSYYSSYNKAFTDLDNDILDYVIVRSIVGKRVIKELGLKGIKGYVSLATSIQCQRVVNDSALAERIDGAIEEMRADGSLSELNRKWIAPFIVPATLTEFIETYPWILATSVILLFIFFAMFLIMRNNHRMEILERSESSRLEKVASDERYNFLVNVSHELRTPLTLVSGPLRHILKSGELDEKNSGIVTRVLNQADRMTTLLNTVLTTNKIEEGADEARPVPVSLNDWVRSTSEEFRDEADNRGMGIKVILDPSVGVVNMDEHLCKIVVSNMMINAMRYNSTGSPIEVSTRWSSDGGDFVRISVKDFGNGIGEVDMSRLFKRYYRATEEKTGFGIGLAYSKTIVDAHNGRIGAYNNPSGSGATFWFELPADKSAKVESARVIRTEIDQNHVAPVNLKEATVLFVDDDKDLREYMSNELDGLCKNLYTAYNGKNAIDLMAENIVDVVITDVMMPEIDGITLCKTIKGDPIYKDIPVIMLTARADSESMNRGMSAMANYYMDKPFVIDNLIDVLEKNLSKGRIERS